jgi:hypothetical protein
MKMKTRILRYRLLITTIILFTMVSISTISCSQGNTSSSKSGNEVKQHLTPDQATKIKSILSQYDPAALTPEIAREINNKFREAGIHPGPETKDAINQAGFDPEKLRSLSPPPEKSGKEGKIPPSSEERLKNVDEKIIKPLGLNADQSAVIISAYKDFFTEMEKLRSGNETKQGPPDRSKVEPLERARDEKISKVLTEAQLSRYRELEKLARPPKPEDKQAR